MFYLTFDPVNTVFSIFCLPSERVMETSSVFNFF